MSAPAFQIVKGSPSDAEVAALTMVFTQLSQQARAQAAGAGVGERNLWGRLEDRYSQYGAQEVFIPSAFRNVRYY